MRLYYDENFNEIVEYSVGRNKWFKILLFRFEDYCYAKVYVNKDRIDKKKMYTGIYKDFFNSFIYNISDRNKFYEEQNKYRQENEDDFDLENMYVFISDKYQFNNKWHGYLKEDLPDHIYLLQNSSSTQIKLKVSKNLYVHGSWLASIMYQNRNLPINFKQIRENSYKELLEKLENKNKSEEN